MKTKVTVANYSYSVKQRVEKQYGQKMKNVVFTAANYVRSEAILSIGQGAKSGRIYKRGNIFHQASAAGQAPATDTGFLVNNIALVFDADRTGASVESRAPYSGELEFGTKNMGARPFLHPAVEKSRPKIVGWLKKFKVKI